jgi:hypothetical protein
MYLILKSWYSHQDSLSSEFTAAVAVVLECVFNSAPPFSNFSIGLLLLLEEEEEEEELRPASASVPGKSRFCMTYLDTI